MRIIAGQFRGRKLLPPLGDATRPITDRAKQSLFDVIAPLIPDAAVYDLFCGTGSMGLEALSRGARRAMFFDADRSAIARLRQNIAALGVEETSMVLGADLFRFFVGTGTLSSGIPKADLVFLDPPYRFLRERAEELRRLASALAARHLNAGATVIFRHDVGDELALPPLVEYDRRTYGGMAIELLRA